MVEAVGSLPTFTEVRFVTKDGEHISATKNNDIVTVVGDKNGMRQLPLSAFMQYMTENAQNLNLERQPNNDEVAFKANNVSSHDRIKAYQKAQPKRGTALLGLASLTAMLPMSIPMLFPESGISKKICNFMDKNKYGRIAMITLTAAGLLGMGTSIIKADREKRAILKEQNLA